MKPTKTTTARRRRRRYPADGPVPFHHRCASGGPVPAGTDPPHPPGALLPLERSHRGPGFREVGKPATHRFLQAPGGPEPGLRPHGGGAGPGGGDRLLGEPRPGSGHRRDPPGGPGGDLRPRRLPRDQEAGHPGPGRGLGGPPGGGDPLRRSGSRGPAAGPHRGVRLRVRLRGPSGGGRTGNPGPGDVGG